MKTDEDFHDAMSRKKSEVINEPLITKNLIVVLLAVGFGTSFQYYNNSVVNNIVLLAQTWFNGSFHEHYGWSLKPSDVSILWSFSSAALQIGAIFGSLMVYCLSEGLGRRKSLMITGCTSSVGTAMAVIAFYSNYLELFIVGRFVIGLSLGAGIGISSMFINEIAPIRYRGACGSVQQLFVGFGNLLSLVVTLPYIWGSKNLWILAIGAPIVAGITQVITLTFCQDSPRYLIMTKNLRESGLKAIKFYRGESYCRSTLKTIEYEMEISDDERTHVSDLWRYAKFWKPLSISLVIIFGVQFSGIGPVMAYSKQMFSDAGLDDITAQVATVGIGCCTFLSPFLTMILVEKAGRKKILLGGLTTCFVAMTMFVICAEISSRYGFRLAQLGSIPCMYVYQIGFSLASSIVWIVPAELFPQSARSPAMTVITFFMWVFQAVTVLAYLPFKDAVGVSYSFLPFLICIFVTVSYLACYMPETRGKSVEEIVRLFDGVLLNTSSDFEESEHFQIRKGNSRVSIRI